MIRYHLCTFRTTWLAKKKIGFDLKNWHWQKIECWMLERCQIDIICGVDYKYEVIGGSKSVWTKRMTLDVPHCTWDEVSKKHERKTQWVMNLSLTIENWGKKRWNECLHNLYSFIHIWIKKRNRKWKMEMSEGIMHHSPTCPLNTTSPEPIPRHCRTFWISQNSTVL